MPAPFPHFSENPLSVVNAQLGVWYFRQVGLDSPTSSYPSVGVYSNVDVNSRWDVSRPACRLSLSL